MIPAMDCRVLSMTANEADPDHNSAKNMGLSYKPPESPGRGLSKPLLIK
jgi:hypothetical protein